jgi:hypothetical protein
MRLALVRTVLAALSIAAFAVPLYASDDLDEVLSSVAATVDSALVSPATIQAVESAVGDAESSSHTVGVQWHPVVASPPHESLPASGGAMAHPRQPMPSSGMSVVPEPSAVALAALALIYFLVFGRRTRWG